MLTAAAIKVEPAMVATSAFLRDIDPKRNPAFSPNLRRFLRRRPLCANVFLDKEGTRWIGFIDGAFLVGARLLSTCGARPFVGAWIKLVPELTPDPEFWTRYLAIGRCAIDDEHRGWWVNDGERWSVRGNTRTCRWCGHKQRRRRWTERVRHERWEPTC